MWVLYLRMTTIDLVLIFIIINHFYQNCIDIYCVCLYTRLAQTLENMSLILQLA